MEERTQKHLLNIALSRTQIFQWSFDMEHNLMIIEPVSYTHLNRTVSIQQESDCSSSNRHMRIGKSQFRVEP